MAGGPDENGMDLDALLRAARTVPVPDALLAQVLADGVRVQAGFAPAAPVRPAMRPRMPVARPGALRRLVRAAGGGLSCVVLATATLAGLWIGLSQPDALSPVSRHLWPDATGETVELIPSLDEVLSYAEG